MDEFALIDLLVAELGDQTRSAAIVLGAGDDAAVVEPVPGQLLVSSIDALVANVHFPAGANAALIGYRALAVSVSDLAAMGADPLYCLIALTTPTADPDWLRAFARGVATASFEFRCPVAGGNLARGPHNVCVSVHGQVPPDSALERGGARPGHRVLVSGCLGAAAAALADPALTSAGLTLDDVRRRRTAQPGDPVGRYFMPEPRLELGRALRGIASAAIDVSDGLLADLGHLCRASGCGASIDIERLPRAAAASLEQALYGGDDYELCLTAAPEAERRARDVAAAIGVPLAAIGEIVPGDGVALTRGGRPFDAPSGTPGGFRHFR
jgi:thiamine-monophosphate kinase